jgi:mRNA interferase RelE/StbE
MYDIQLSSQAEKFFYKLDKYDQERIGKKFEELKNNPRLGHPYTADLAGSWKLRVGKFRAIYTIRDKELVVLVLKLDYRKRSYKK